VLAVALGGARGAQHVLRDVRINLALTLAGLAGPRLLDPREEQALAQQYATLVRDLSRICGGRPWRPY